MCVVEERLGGVSLIIADISKGLKLGSNLSFVCYCVVSGSAHCLLDDAMLNVSLSITN